MTLDDFQGRLLTADNNERLTEFCRKHVLHGTPYVFNGNDESYYDFRKKIADKFSILFREIYLTGSGKLGFSPFKQKVFDYDSDIDIAIISPNLFSSIMDDIAKFQILFRQNRTAISESELKMYHDFLEYVAMGWIRPDKLPVSFQMKAFKDDWFEFFRSLSYGRSEVGNYKVNAGVFKSYRHLEEYVVSGMNEVRNRLSMRQYNGSSD